MALFGADYDQVQVGGDFKSLPAGGYVCRIIKAKQTKNSNGLPMVEALIDIIDGEYAQFFTNKFEDNKKKYPDAKWPNNGKIKVTAVDENGNTKVMFKSFVTAVEESNDIQLPRHDDAFLKALASKEIGVIFGREEFEGTDGKPHWSTKPRWFRSVQTIESGDFDVPEDQYLGFSTLNTKTTGSADSFSAAEDDIPF